jgi:dTDP-4-dehydrorhamnose reductase
VSRTVLITGAAGQLGFELQRIAPPNVRVVAVDLPELDLTDTAATEAFVNELRPHVIINCAAYTAVDRAESEPAVVEAVNVRAPMALAAAAARGESHMIHISTDFVFGASKGRPFAPTDATHPVSVYGRTKRDGERAVLAALPHRATVMRTAWLYSVHGGNFVKTMLRLMRERDDVRVIADQVGSPTWARSLAASVWAATLDPVPGVFHWTDAGVASWYDFAVAIQEEALACGVLDRTIPVHAIRTEEYPTPAARPSYSVLDVSTTRTAFGVRQAHWRSNLRAMLNELRYA